jgi:hypothetical protein
MAPKTATMQAVVEAVQDAATTDDEAIAVLTHLLSTRGLVLAQRSRNLAQIAKSFF